ncbi:MAG: transketolase [Bacteroidetes bacterium]|nr:transketolase [Bacteroidota bacterium]MDA0942651.1 transketolase [Bacteroidota bacterium]MDA1111959.1 transketolase [Bacteroidota bacterium]
MRSTVELQSMTSQVRRDIVRMVHAVNSGHPGGSLGCADYLTALFFRYMKHQASPFDIQGKGQDVFFLSNGHISPVFYSVLARSGYFPVSELASFRKINTRLQGHPTTHEGLEGVRIASGSLGQGLSVATGTALQKKLDKDSSTVWVLTGDGELQEGQIWEAVMFAAHNKVDNMIVAIDFNKQQIDGSTQDVMGLTEWTSKFEAFGWAVLEMDGNDWSSMETVIPQAQALLGQGKPIAIVMKTEMGQGVDYMMGTHAWHGKAPNDEQLAKALAQLPESSDGDY